MTPGAVVTHEDCLLHRMQEGHPERPERLAHVLAHLEASGLGGDLARLTPQPASLDVLAGIHGREYLELLQRHAPSEGLVRVDPDTAMGTGSLRAAALAAGAVMDATRAVLAGELRWAFCAVRPPGHHAEESAAMGFCFYNNVALGAHVALAEDLVGRVAILDFDVHHGNGTIDIFKDRPEVLVCSSFQHPFYPNRLFDIERPNIVNTPLQAGTDGTGFRRAVERDWLPAVDAHKPELIFVSAGFDAHMADPLGGLLLDEEDFRWVTTLIVDAAKRHTGGRVVSTLEGGYDLNALAHSVEAHLRALLD
jgi:acetoin utilization deacetylase AcuC-like enzyme